MKYTFVSGKTDGNGCYVSSGPGNQLAKRRKLGRACQSCRLHRTRCDDKMPCTQCRTRKVRCQRTDGDLLQDTASLRSVASHCLLPCSTDKTSAQVRCQMLYSLGALQSTLKDPGTCRRRLQTTIRKKLIRAQAISHASPAGRAQAPATRGFLTRLPHLPRGRLFHVSMHSSRPHQSRFTNNPRILSTLSTMGQSPFTTPALSSRTRLQ